MKLRKRNAFYLAGGAIIAVLLILAFIPDPIPVEIAAVTRGPMTVAVSEQGKTRVIDRFTITASAAGRLQRIDLKEGAPIARGDIVARIDPTPLEPARREELRALLDAAVASQREASAAAQRAESAAQLARSERRRIEQLVASGVLSESSRDEARSAAETAERDLAAARARVRSAESNVTAARARLLSTQENAGGAFTEVRSPAAGRVLRVPDRSARVVQPGQAILEIGNATRIELVIEVLSEDAVKIKPGDAVIVRDWGGAPPLRGTVRVVEPSAFTKISALGIEEQRVNVIAGIADPPPSLGDAYRIEADVIIWSDPSVVKVPVSALGRDGEQWTVFIIDDGRARKRPVDIGERNSEFAQVLKGLEPGAKVIVHPAMDVDDGVRVKAIVK